MPGVISPAVQYAAGVAAVPGWACLVVAAACWVLALKQRPVDAGRSNVLPLGLWLGGFVAGAFAVMLLFE